MTADKRKRSREEESEEPQVNAAADEAFAKQPELKKPNIVPNSGLLTLAIKKLAELEKYVNQEDDDEEEDYDSDYSDSSESGRFAGGSRSTSSGDSGHVHDNRPVMAPAFSPEIVGFAMCAQETMNFLRTEGFNEDHSLIRSMQQRLLDQLNQYQVALNSRN